MCQFVSHHFETNAPPRNDVQLEQTVVVFCCLLLRQEQVIASLLEKVCSNLTYAYVCPLTAFKNGVDDCIEPGCRHRHEELMCQTAAVPPGGAQMVHEGRCESLKRLKQTVDAVGKGTECGIQLKVLHGGMMTNHND
jgi:hypothetical protein